MNPANAGFILSSSLFFTIRETVLFLAHSLSVQKAIDSFCVVEDDSQSVPLPFMQSADSMA